MLVTPSHSPPGFLPAPRSFPSFTVIPETLASKNQCQWAVAPHNRLEGKTWAPDSVPPHRAWHHAEHTAGAQQMPSQPYTWLGSEAPRLGPDGARLWGHRRLPPRGPPATSSPTNLGKLGQELLLHVFGVNPGLLLLPGGGGLWEKKATVFPPPIPGSPPSLPIRRAAPVPPPQPHREQLGPGFFTAMASTRAS